MSRTPKQVGYMLLYAFLLLVEILYLVGNLSNGNWFLAIVAVACFAWQVAIPLRYPEWWKEKTGGLHLQAVNREKAKDRDISP